MQKPLVLPLLLWKFLNSDFQRSVFQQSPRAVTFHTCCFQFVWCLYLLVWICQDLITNWHLISFRWKWIPLRHLEKTHEVTSKSVTISPMFFQRTFGVLSSACKRSVYYHLRANVRCIIIYVIGYILTIHYEKYVAEIYFE